MDRTARIVSGLPLLLLAACNSGNGSPPDPLRQAAEARIALGKSAVTALHGAGSCQALEDELKAVAAAEIRTWFEMYGDTQAMPVDSGSGGGAPAAGDDANGAGGEAADYTNNQVAGVDEADFVKTDGERLYLLEGGKLHRFDIDVDMPGAIAANGSQALEGWPLAMLLDGNRVLVISATWDDAAPAGDGFADIFMLPERVKATLLEWPDDAAPDVVSERWFDGWYVTARAVDSSARLVLHGRLPNPVRDALWRYAGEHDSLAAAEDAALDDLAALPLAELLPQSYRRGAGGDLETVAYTDEDCADFEIPADSNGSGATTLATLALDDAGAFEAQHIVSNAPVAYMSANHLVLAESAQDWWWFWWNETEDERLNLHVFDVADGGLDYAGSARAEGIPVNQFALDEHDGVLRVATWVGGTRWWWTEADIESRLYTFAIEDDALVPLGELAGVAPGEQLFAARFDGEVAYLVTFEQIDPLFTVDLSDPAAPAILGELEVPGFSTYLHPVAGNRLLAVGIGGDDSGVTWNTVVTLFDVADLAAPAKVAQHDFAYDASGWNWSEALYEHKAFQFNAAENLLALPLSASREDNGVWQWVSTLELVRLDGDALTNHGRIDHSAYFDSNDADYYGSADIRRSFFIGEYIYAVSGKAVSVHPVDNPALTVADALVAQD